MKEKKFTNKLKLIFSLIFFIFTIQSSLGVDIVAYDLTFDENDNGFGEQTGTFSTSAGLTNLTFDFFSGAFAENWNSTDGGFQYWQISPFSTIGYHTIQVAAFMNSDPEGPANFELQYKISAGGIWANAQNISVDGISTNNSVTLPEICNNKSEVYVRWITRDYKDISGNTISNTARSYISSITVIGSSPVTPSSQATNIAFVSITPTTITIDCSAGNGDNRIIAINNSNTWTNPTNDQIFASNSSYPGTGQQVIYNGNLTRTTVSVPSSRNPYYFRIYEYNYNGGMTRYLTTTISGKNPKLCSLETIDANPATLIRLTTATISATISAPQKFAIGDRGFAWKTSPGVTDQDSKISEGTRTIGTFIKALSNLPRSTRIYYKGYVTNASGTIYSNELYFDNIPIFSGTGNWETDTQWNVLQVPGSGTTFGSILDKPTIDGLCTLTSNTSCNSLIINSGKKLIVSPSASLNVTTSITNSAGNSGILVESNDTDPSGSLIFHNSAGNPVSATVEMYSKAKWDLSKPTGSKYSWQFFGLPVKTLPLNPTFSSAWVRKWEEIGQTDVDLWVMQNTGATLSSITGYELVQSAAKTYSFAGQLENQGFTRSLPYTSGAVYPGQHIFGNPFTAAINIESIEFGANTENSVYLYNTGTYNEWDTNLGETTTTTVEGRGQYTVSTPLTSGDLGVPSQIPSMQGFLVKSINATGSITITYVSSVPNTDMQRTKANVEVAKSEKVVTRIDIKSTHYSDRLWIFTDPACTRSFDNGWDGPKMLGSSQRTQLFSMEEDGNYQINAIRNINDTYLGFQPGEDKEFKLIFTHQNIESTYSGIYLIDLEENKTMDITTSGCEYTFTSEPSTNITKRFKIVTKPSEESYNSEKNSLKLFHSNSAIFVQNFSNNVGSLILYKTNGATLQRVNFNANTVASFSTADLSPGIYLAKAFVDNEETTQRIIIR